MSIDCDSNGRIIPPIDSIVVDLCLCTLMSCMMFHCLLCYLLEPLKVVETAIDHEL